MYYMICDRGKDNKCGNPCIFKFNDTKKPLRRCPVLKKNIKLINVFRIFEVEPIEINKIKTVDGIGVLVKNE